MRRGTAIASAIAALIAAIAGHERLAPPRELGGIARVIDGDTLAFGEDRARLLGLDAPELSQTCRREAREFACGQEVARALASRVAGRALRCAGRRHDQYNRLLARCSLGEEDIGAWLVGAGLARAARDDAYYASLERRARRERRGLWAGAWEDPASFRDRRP